MNLRAEIERIYAFHTEALVSSGRFQALEGGSAPRAAYDAFIADLCRTHLKSPQILAFLYSVAPPLAAESVKHNLLEELGLDSEGGVPHPALLRQLALALGQGDAGVRALEADAHEDLRRLASDPILYGTIKELGLSVLLEVAGFEWMLSRVSGRMAVFLQKHRGLPADAVAWFAHHAEVDIRHAEEQLDTAVSYAQHYDLGGEHFTSILELTFRENIFSKRYFRS
jgi:hypothetical protein